ncbi:MAG: hypothetical protein KJ737_06085 [Proteobacteria bacterium]|nr:hypothetical protein [Pseudomonadota bacterium]
MGITEYYDNRKAVVTASFDDWQNNSDGNFITACNKFQERQLWASAGIITGDLLEETWTHIQDQIDDGFIEPVSHSQNHLGDPLFCLNATVEVGQSSVMIKDNLMLPVFNQNGSHEYVYAYLLPFGLICNQTLMAMMSSTYLVSRNSNSSVTGFSPWRSDYNIYAPAGFTIRMGYDTEEDKNILNHTFDSVYDTGGIYHLNLHPWALGDAEWVSYGDAHLDHIKDKKDIWYVSFGHLYLYHFMKEKELVTVITAEQ